MISTAKKILAGAGLLTLLSMPALAQSAAPASSATPAFQAADIHTSEHSNTPQTRGGTLHGDRYTLRQATMTNLIGRAYGLEDTYVLSGPAWLDLDRFDISAQAPRTTSPGDLKLMMRALLLDRFKLVTHSDTKPLPAFLLTVSKGEPKFKPSAATADADGSPDGQGFTLSGCAYQQPPANTPPSPMMQEITFHCHGVTMAGFVTFLHQLANPYLHTPVVDQTGLKGAYDFDIHWSYQPPKGDTAGTTIFDAVDKQLGLKLTAATAPLPVVIVDSVNETPTPNPPGTDKALPPLPPAAFDVAVVKPSSPDQKGTMLNVRGAQIVINGATLDFLITWSWDISSGRIANPPDFLAKNRFDVLGKAAVDGSASGPGSQPQIDFDDLQQMVKTLLADRFEMKSHMEDRPADAYTLVAAGPHMKKADPQNRTGCKNGPGPDGKDPRIDNPLLGRLVSCSNITMAQFAAQLQSMAPGFIKNQVIDATGIEGAYDFTLAFSTAGQLRAPATAPPPPPPGGGDAGTSGASVAAAPTGGVSLFDALTKTLGLKLEKRKGTMPMLVIDHIDEQPTDN
jgi:uncharacterized protein (TIGR03435 family)